MIMKIPDAIERWTQILRWAAKHGIVLDSRSEYHGDGIYTLYGKNGRPYEVLANGETVRLRHDRLCDFCGNTLGPCVGDLCEDNESHTVHTFCDSCCLFMEL